ncbi:neurotrypsin-like [Amphiura filiformis]|uniref:neurotrypsin-like n=1 Tax=Amphiura filiformis TaxID=82378 RepID=UPI003B21B7E3
MTSTLQLLFMAIGFIVVRFVKLETITGIRLLDESGTLNPRYGRVELQLDYNTHGWYGVCERGSYDLSHHIWNRMTANVACRQLGFLGGWNYSMHGISTRYTLEDFRCGLDTDTLDNCYYDYPELCGCAPSRDIIDDILNQCNYKEHKSQYQAAVSCYGKTDIDNIHIRLVPKTTLDPEVVKSETPNNYGKLEISFLDQWYDVCFHGIRSWTIEDATVACRHMGFELGAIETRRQEENAKRQYSFSSFNCLGTETNLFACLPDPPRNASCKDNDNVYIRCNGNVGLLY